MLAALAASTKLEGIPLAATPDRRRPVAASVVRSAAPRLRSLGGAVLRLACTDGDRGRSPWLIQGLRHDLFRDPQSGAFELDRAPAIAVSLWQAMLRPEWHLAPLVLLLLPLLLLRRDTRLVGAVVTLLLAGYVLRYFTASFDYQFSVLSSFPRLVFHVLPAVVVGARRGRGAARQVALLGARRRRRRCATVGDARSRRAARARPCGLLARVVDE